jgi:hypothetical protein
LTSLLFQYPLKSGAKELEDSRFTEDVLGPIVSQDEKRNNIHIKKTGKILFIIGPPLQQQLSSPSSAPE